MKYAGMPFGMWVLFAGSFQKQLTAVLGYDAATAPTVLANDYHADSRSIPYQRAHTSSTPPVVLSSNSTASIQEEVSERTDTSQPLVL